jgi:hypothetical protein
VPDVQNGRRQNLIRNPAGQRKLEAGGFAARENAHFHWFRKNAQLAASCLLAKMT